MEAAHGETRNATRSATSFGRADPLRAARDERPAAIEFELLAHPRISSDAISSRSKTN
jgi:hypothetical protein